MSCIHDLYPVYCAVCNGAEKRAQAERPVRGPWLTAQFPGKCSGCGDGIGPGGEIRASGEGGWLCGDCGDRP